MNEDEIEEGENGGRNVQQHYEQDFLSISAGKDETEQQLHRHVDL